MDEQFQEYLTEIRLERHLEVKHGGRVRNADPYGEIWVNPLGINGLTFPPSPLVILASVVHTQSTSIF